jgi:hypothetical protein
LFLYIVLYSQLVVAAEWQRNSYKASSFYPAGKRSYRATAAGMEMPAPAPAAAPDPTPADSSVTPVRKAKKLSLSASGSGAKKKPNSIGGPSQPEMQSFSPVSANNMVDLFSGDFSYNIPLLDVGGYPVNISYHSGRSMDEDASWVGQGWNINPGSITRDMRGLPDDFNGGTDTVKKTQSIKPNINWGISAGGDIELFGIPLPGANAGIFHTTYNGWGLETGFSPSLSAGDKSLGKFTGKLSISNNSQSGITLSPSLSVQSAAMKVTDNGSAAFGLQLGAPYNSRTGIKDIQLGFTSAVTSKAMQNHKYSQYDLPSADITFSWPSYTPDISMPMTNYNFTFTIKPGTELSGSHPSLYFKGYYGREYIAAADSSLALPAYGYLNFQNRGSGWSALTDFNREKEMTYRETPAIPHIAVPSYTYDIFSMSGEGNGGMFRAYRGDIGFIADHLIASKTTTGAASIDLGGADIVHGGTDLNANYSVTQTGPWLLDNPLRNTIDFRKSNGLFEASYFRNPGEKTSNAVAYYNAIGGDNTVTPMLSQPGGGSSILASNYLGLYNGAQKLGVDTLTTANAVKNNRDKRSQVISYLTAEQASVSGLDKYINRYTVNLFGNTCESDAVPADAGLGTGILGYYFPNQSLEGVPYKVRLDPFLYFGYFANGSGPPGSPFDFANSTTSLNHDKGFPDYNFSNRWLGRLKAPDNGTYTFSFFMDDGFRIWMNDSLILNDWHVHGGVFDTVHVNLVAGRMYDIRAEYFQATKGAYIEWEWRKPSDKMEPIKPNQGDKGVPNSVFYPPVFTDTVPVNQYLTREDRVNTFRKSNHISEIDVLNPDGRRYVYGIPVYNVKQDEVSFAISKGNGNVQTGLTTYTSGVDNSVLNNNGKNGYYSREEIPAYAHSFLLTGILSPDYVDVTGDGISDDDIGDAVKFNYSKTSGVANPFGWRAPYAQGQATYNEGLRSYDRDDKGHYIYGTKELWYMHTIESKTMIATFTLQPRADMMEIDEYGTKSYSGKAMCLKEINLYSKADFMANGVSNAVPVKTVHFEYSYELCRGINAPLNDSGKLTLKKIWFTYNGNKKGQVNPYVFNYHANNPTYQFNHADKWGTYKDPAQNPGATTSNPLPNSDYPYALQDSAQAAYNAGAWMLDSIQLPSGGRIKVNYESDDYAYVQNRRATLMCGIAGIGTDTSGHYNNRLYNFLIQDGLYVYVKVPYTVNPGSDIYAHYLDGISKLYFRLYVTMPKDDFGSGSEFVPCYADPDVSAGHWYGRVNDHVIWIKVKGVNTAGNADGVYSPLAQTAINYLRLNLPDKAYPGSELNDNITPTDGIKILLTQITNITGLFNGYNSTARGNGWASIIDTSSRSFVRLDDPALKKYGGGLRVKSVLIYDNWNAMTGKKQTVYGQQYDYTTTQSVNGVDTKISSGVAAWEPSVGAEENPFHLPIEYVDKVSLLAPAALQYTEEPLGESFFPGPSVGYSKVRVRSIHTAGTRSANGYSESTFYTSYDFPTTWDYTRLDPDTKKRYKPILNNLLRINQKNYLTLSQGFKVELNDMNGKPKTEATYAETDSNNLISYTANYYKVDNQSVQFKHLNNTATTIDPQGNINPNGMIGKDAELMGDMRDETSNTTGANVNINVDVFAAGVWPLAIPSLLDLYQHETNQFRSVAMTKVIQRYGILDSVVHIDKGSKIYSKNLLYDEETGDPLLVRTQNEFNDSLFSFTYPSHWAYKGTGPAYQNIDAQLSHLTVVDGLITSGLPAPASTYLVPGDELYVSSRVTITPNCDPSKNLVESFPNTYKLWVIDSIPMNSSVPVPYLVDQFGTPFSGNDVSFVVTRSGHRNLGSPIGSVSSLGNPLVADAQGAYHLVLDSTRRVLTAGATEMQQLWRVADKRRSNILSTCIYTSQDSALAAAEGCSCMKPFFDYLITHQQLYSSFEYPARTVGSIAAAAGISLSSCPLLQNNASKLFRVLTPVPNSSIYQAFVGDALFQIRSVSGYPFNIYNMTSSCNAQGQVVYHVPGLVAPVPDTITVNVSPSFANMISSSGTTCPAYLDTLLSVDTTSDQLLVENSLTINGSERNAISILNFGRLDRVVPSGDSVLSAKLLLYADHRGHLPPTYPNANSTNPVDSIGVSLSSPAGWFPHQYLDTMLYQAYYTPWFSGAKNATAFQDVSMDATSYVNGYLTGNYGSTSLILTQGSGPLHSNRFDSAMVAMNAIPPYLTSGYGNYYSTYYSSKYADTSKRPVLQLKFLNYPFVDTTGAVLEYNSSIDCNTVYGRSCYSSITDTMVNPYQYAILGNYRPQRSYVYYGQRKETDPLAQVNMRTAGTIPNFAPFWTLQSGIWAPSYDTTRWVWNSQTTLFNRKGFELENKDPLGRYNSGLYGYGLTLPTAVTQNSRYQESAFEGFEDYGFKPNSCDTTCAEARPFDFSAYESNISDSAAHSGLYSLRIPKGGSISLVGLPVASAPDADDPVLSDTLGATSCGTRFAGVKASMNTVIPPFKPFAGKRMLVGAWVKEEDSCSCQTYSNNHLLLSFSLTGGGSSSITLLPSGNMIEGWQRYEAIIDLPATATSLTLVLQGSASSTTFFDDIRIHPFNAEMKSYVYNPVNLRLMAELDENNYATFYEYDDDGTLIRVKKETERGIQTIKETRSALLKDQ